MGFHLECTSGQLQGKRVPLRPGKAVTFGRDRANTASILDRKLSRIHCQIEIINDRIVLTDLNSTNGTFVNGKRIEETAIKPGDVISLGRVQFALVETPDVEEPETAPVAAESPKCSACGAEVPEEDMASGAAGRVGSRAYCARCRARFSARGPAAEPAAAHPEQGQAPSAAVEAPGPGTEVGGCRIVEKLGDGDVGPVYLAEQKATGRRVLLKLLTAGDAQWARRYLQAVYASGRLIHNNIVLVYDTGEIDGRFYVCREYVDGRCLAVILNQQGKLPPAEALTIVVQVAQAFRYAREFNVIHGALAPCNLFISRDAVAKIANFGLTSCRAPSQPPPKEDMAILPYLPPEAMSLGVESLDFTSDCYSAGAVFFHMLTGRPPFLGSTIEKLQARILEKPAPLVSQLTPGLPPATDQIVQRCLEKIPGARYQQPREFLYDLEEVLRREL